MYLVILLVFFCQLVSTWNKVDNYLLSYPEPSLVLHGSLYADKFTITTDCSYCLVQLNSIFYTLRPPNITITTANKTLGFSDLRKGSSFRLTPPINVELGLFRDYVLAFTLTNLTNMSSRGLVDYRLEKLTGEGLVKSIVSYTVATALSVTTDKVDEIRQYLSNIQVSPSNCYVDIYTSGVPNEVSKKSHRLITLSSDEAKLFMESRIQPVTSTFIIPPHCQLDIRFLGKDDYHDGPPALTIGSMGFVMSPEYSQSYSSFCWADNITDTRFTESSLDEAKIEVSVVSVSPGLNGYLDVRIIPYGEPKKAAEKRYTNKNTGPSEQTNLGASVEFTWVPGELPRGGFLLRYKVSKQSILNQYSLFMISLCFTHYFTIYE